MTKRVGFTYEQQVMLNWLRQHEIHPQPEVEYVFHPVRRWRLDYAWPAQKVALEQEGGIYGGKDPKTGRRYKGAHGSIAGIKRDMVKYSEAAILGWKVLRVPPDEIHTMATADLIRRAIIASDITP